MAGSRGPATFEELHVSYPDESVTETICQYAYDEILQRIPKGKVVVDIGCGIGTLASRIADTARSLSGKGSSTLPDKAIPGWPEER